MATVRITKELTEQITGNARAKFADRIKAVEATAPVGWGDYIYEKLFGEYVPLMEQLPEEFFDVADKIAVQRVGAQAVNLHFTLSSRKRWPKHLPADAPAEVNYYGGALILKDDLMWGELYAEVVAWKDKCAAIRKQAGEFTEGVSKILASYSTLSPALKAWPPLWELVPEHTKSKHKEIVERKKPEKELPEIDTTKLTAVLAASKIGGL
jgi:hypothetical protein